MSEAPEIVTGMGVSALMALSIREFFAWMKGKKNGNGNGHAKCEKIDEALSSLAENSVRQTEILRDIHNNQRSMSESIIRMEARARD